jgi:peptidyl-prolyl cis-trans isomerase C
MEFRPTRLLACFGTYFICLGMTLPASAQIVARVGDTEISLDEFERRARSLRESGYQHLQAVDDAARRELLDGVIAQELIVLEGYRQGVDQDPVVGADLARHERRALMTALYDTQALHGDYTSTEEEQRAYYHEHRFDEEVDSRHIVCASEQEGRTVIKELNAGASFDSLLAIYTLPDVRRRFGPSGRVGWFRVGSLYDEVIEPMSELAVGQFCPEPVQTSLGYHVFLLESRRPVPFESSGEFVREKLRVQQRANDMESYVNSLRERYEVTIDAQGLEALSHIRSGVDTYAGHQPLVTWQGGRLSVADYMEIVRARRARHPANEKPGMLAKGVDNHAGQHVMMVEARRLGLDHEPDVRVKFEGRRRELFAKWLFIQETRRRVEADTSAANVRQFYEENLDLYTRDDGQVTELSVVEASIRGSMLRHAETRAMDEFLGELREQYTDQIYIDENALKRTFFQVSDWESAN